LNASTNKDAFSKRETETEQETVERRNTESARVEERVEYVYNTEVSTRIHMGKVCIPSCLYSSSRRSPRTDLVLSLSHAVA